MRDNRSDPLLINNPYWSTLGRKRTCQVKKVVRSGGKIRDVLSASPKHFSTSSFVLTEARKENGQCKDPLVTEPLDATEANTVEIRRVPAQKSFCTSAFHQRREEPVGSKEEKDPPPTSSTESLILPTVAPSKSTQEILDGLQPNAPSKSTQDVLDGLQPIASSSVTLETKTHVGDAIGNLDDEHDKLILGTKPAIEVANQQSAQGSESLQTPDCCLQHNHLVVTSHSHVQQSPQLEVKTNVSLASFLEHYSPAHSLKDQSCTHLLRKEQHPRIEQDDILKSSLSSKKESPLSMTLHGKRDDTHRISSKLPRHGDAEASLATFFVEPHDDQISKEQHSPIREINISKKASPRIKPMKLSRAGDANKRVCFSGESRDTAASSENDSKMQSSAQASSRSSTSAPSGAHAFLPPSLKRFASNERSLKEQIQSLTPKGRNCLALFRQQWDSDHQPMPGHLYICVARCCGFNLQEGRKLLSQFEERYLRLTATRLEPQLLTQTIFPVPGLKSVQGLDMFFMRPALFYPQFMKTQTIIDNLAYVMLSMVEKEEAATNGIGVVIYMNEFTKENFSEAYWRHLMKMLQGGVPARLGLALIVNAPSWFEAIWKPMKRELQPVFVKKIKMIKERMLYQALAPGYQSLLPDETAVGSADTTNLVKDFVAYRKFVEANRSKPKEW